LLYFVLGFKLLSYRLFEICDSPRALFLLLGL